MNQIAFRSETLPAVQADIHYLAPMAERPRHFTFDPPDGGPRTNIVTDPRSVTIRDMRPVAAELSLDVQGFQLVRQRSAVQDFFDPAIVKAEYLPEAEALLKAVTGADRVFIFDATTRRRVEGATDAPGARQPVQRAHVDHTAQSGPERVRFWMGEEADLLLRGRVQVINLWRPISGPVQDMPLALADARSVAAKDLVASDLVYRDRVGETYQVLYNPAHRWFYAPQMQADEALLIKCFDSAEDGRARFAPHTAFTDPGTTADAPKRESIELRALVFHYPH